jgi:hypothetical protein
MLLLIAERFSLCSAFLCLNVNKFSLLVSFCGDQRRKKKVSVFPEVERFFNLQECVYFVFYSTLFTLMKFIPASLVINSWFPINP